MRGTTLSSKGLTPPCYMPWTFSKKRIITVKAAGRV